MAFTGNRLLCYTSTRTPYTQLPLRRPFLIPPSPSSSHQPRTSSFRVSANPKKLSSSSRTGRFDSKNRRSSVSTKEQEEEEVVEKQRMDEISVDNNTATIGAVDDGFVMPELPGEKPDFWEGPQWDVLGFVLQYLWAFGIVFALIACGIAVATYNEGATDFKDTPVYKESIQSREFLDEPDVFESNPTEQAPSLD
ncbi:unnamed protein product [Fraxinus pennsylvanica]|uniref:Uncharacterized protein n=1 Tax=Fraxinus pennsylvanica TaxID=56036 RepID=A0AAD1ZCP0_9LAMI|nr:unnamed protein product [Fraxinus pennsylvanica]